MLQAAFTLIAERRDRGTSLAAIGEAAVYSRGLMLQRWAALGSAGGAYDERIAAGCARILRRGAHASIEKMVRQGIEAKESRAKSIPTRRRAVARVTARGIGFQWLPERGSFAFDEAYEELKRNLRKGPAP